MAEETEAVGLKTAQSDKEDLEYIRLLLEAIIEQNPNIDANIDEMRTKARSEAREKRGGRGPTGDGPPGQS
jgi:transcription termination factor NusB